MSRPVKDLINNIFGSLTVLKRQDLRNREAAWLCKCVCGNTKIIAGSALRSGRTRHCKPCGIKLRVSKQISHGHTSVKFSPTYMSWSSMMTRCFNKNRKQYKDYGGRGITICPSWHNFTNFLKDMGERPVGTSIDRINVNGNYEPTNCRWATFKQQANNTRRKNKQC